MNEMNDLQNIWKSGSSRITNDINVQKVQDTLMEKLKSLESKQTKLNRLKVLVLVMIFSQMIYWINRINTGSAIIFVGLGIIFTGVLIFMLFYFKNQFNIKKLNFAGSTIDFVNDAIRMLEKQNAIFRAPFLVFSLFIAIGVNVMLTGFPDFEESKMVMHLIYTLLVASSSFLGYKIRKWRTKNEVLPVLEELYKAKKSFGPEVE